jgi:hypothetical protein
MYCNGTKTSNIQVYYEWGEKPKKAEGGVFSSSDSHNKTWGKSKIEISWRRWKNVEN